MKVPARRLEWPELDIGEMLLRLGVKGRRRGRVWNAPCPMPEHEDREPSWSIVDDPEGGDHGSWYCFGCGRGGGPVSLVRSILLLGSDEARKWVSRLERPAKSWRAPVVEIAPRIPGRLEWPIEGVELDVDLWPKAAIDYWETWRGLHIELATAFCVAASGGADECREAPRSIVVPVVSFGSLRTWVARSYVLGAKKKHTSARRVDGAQPDLALWGEPMLVMGPPALVCEGVYDAMSLYACGLPNAVAVLGASNITPAKVAAIARCGSAVICTDADAAGDSAASRLEMALARHCRVARARPPEGFDWGNAPVDSILEVVGRAAKEVER